MSLAAVLTPSGAAFALAFLGLLAMPWRRRRGLSLALLAAAAVTLLVFSSGVVATALMSPLEYAYPTLRDRAAYPDTRHIVVLTAWAADDPDMPLTGRMSTSSAYRVLQALALARECPDCEVIVSGDEKAARIMNQSMLVLGLPAERLAPAEGGTTTADSARRLVGRLHDESFFLVTSGGHMPRSMEAMARFGLKPIAVPTDHQLPRDWRHADWTPSVMHLAVSDLAIHEYIGRLWYRLRDGGVRADQGVVAPPG